MKFSSKKPPKRHSKTEKLKRKITVEDVEIPVQWAFSRLIRRKLSIRKPSVAWLREKFRLAIHQMEIKAEISQKSRSLSHLNSENAVNPIQFSVNHSIMMKFHSAAQKLWLNEPLNAWYCENFQSKSHQFAS